VLHPTAADQVPEISPHPALGSYTASCPHLGLQKQYT
jgi:hypothetical protein